MGLFHRLRDARRLYCTAVVAAAGSSSRMGEEINKLLEPLDGTPVLARTLMALQRAQRVDAIVVAAREADILPFSELCRTYGISKCAKVVRGGENREHSVLLASLEADERFAGNVHMVIRSRTGRDISPFSQLPAAACGAAAPAVPVKDTIKTAQDGQVTQTLDRAALRAVQTPQVFEASLLKAALQSALESGAALTDDCSAVERLGKTVYLTDGDEENLKITTPLDLVLAEAILRRREESI